MVLDEGRQAGAFDNSCVIRCVFPAIPRGEEALRPHFDGPDAALDYARHLVKDGNDVFAFEVGDIAEGYKENRFDIVLHVFFSGGLKHKLILHRVPVLSWGDEKAELFFARNFGGKTYAPRQEVRDQRSVVFYISKLVQGPEEFIPSFVWLEHLQDRNDAGVDSLAPALDIPFEIPLAVCKRKFRTGKRLAAKRDGAGVYSMVQCRPQGAGGPPDQQRDSFGERLAELDCIGIPARLGITLYSSAVWVAIQPFPDHHIETVDIVARIRDQKSRAIEGIFCGHGQPPKRTKNGSGKATRCGAVTGA